MNPTDPSSAPQISFDSVHRRHRWQLLAWSVALTLSAVALRGAAILGWIHSRAWLESLVEIAAFVFLVLWIAREKRLTRHAVAQKLDQRWKLRARLETAVELADEPTALARAQREDAAGKFADHRDHGLLVWLAALAIAFAALGFVGTEGGAWAVRSFAKANASAPTSPSAAPQEKASANLEENASIRWKSPNPTIKATAIEETPLLARVESNAGYRGLTLDVYVNGERRLSRVLPADEARAVARGGSFDVPVSLALEETKAEPYDIVSYALSGELQAVPRVVTSPLQFVQIRPTAEELAESGQADPDGAHVMSELSILKADQLEMLEDDFNLAHLSELKREPKWQTENARLAQDQAELAQRALALKTFVDEKQLVPQIAGNLAKASEAMQDAARQVAAEENTQAQVAQGKALALITACEKFFKRAKRITGKAPLNAPMRDPFRDPRAQTPAGAVEQLADQQRGVANALDKPGQQPGDKPGDPKSAEAEIARQAEQLARNLELDPELRHLLQVAGENASQAVSELDLNDPGSARIHAGAALGALEKAVQRQERFGREAAVELLVRMRRTLNRASRASDSPRADAIDTVSSSLQTAAAQQQRTGSAEVAHALIALREALEARSGHDLESTPRSRGRLREIAARAAQVQVALATPAAAFNRAERQLSRARPQTSGAPLSPELAADLELAAQEAAWLTKDLNVSALSKSASVGLDAFLQQGQNAPTSTAVAVDAVKLADALIAARALGKRDEAVRRFNIDEIDPAYRAAVDTYYEQLSRGPGGSVSAPP